MGKHKKRNNSQDRRPNVGEDFQKSNRYLAPIDFVPATKIKSVPTSFHLSSAEKQNPKGCNDNGAKSAANPLKGPATNVGSSKKHKKAWLFDASLVPSIMRWKRVSGATMGLYNHGNTCYLNSTLQCLLHTPVLVEGLLDEKIRTQALMGLSSKERNGGGRVPIGVILQRLVSEVWGSSGGHHRAISPREVVSNIRRISKSFRPMRQEDAHECYTELLSTIHDELRAVKNIKLSDPLAETTFVSRCFGGGLASELVCPRKGCAYVSQNRSYTHDISIDLTAGSLKQCMNNFFATETLKPGNEWTCGGCKQKVLASKRFRFLEAPNVLTVHLKRFTYGMSKISRHVAFDSTLEIRADSATMHTIGERDENSKSKRVKYRLYAVLVHHGGSTHSGHYTAYAVSPNGQWCHYDDSSVHGVSLNTVLAQKAYLLFYTKDTPIKEDPIKADLEAKFKNQIEKVEVEKVEKVEKANVIVNDNDAGRFVERKSLPAFSANLDENYSTNIASKLELLRKMEKDAIHEAEESGRSPSSPEKIDAAARLAQQLVDEDTDTSDDASISDSDSEAEKLAVPFSNTDSDSSAGNAATAVDATLKRFKEFHASDSDSGSGSGSGSDSGSDSDGDRANAGGSNVTENPNLGVDLASDDDEYEAFVSRRRVPGPMRFNLMNSSSASFMLCRWTRSRGRRRPIQNLYRRNPVYFERTPKSVYEQSKIALMSAAQDEYFKDMVAADVEDEDDEIDSDSNDDDEWTETSDEDLSEGSWRDADHASPTGGTTATATGGGGGDGTSSESSEDFSESDSDDVQDKQRNGLGVKIGSVPFQRKKSTGKPLDNSHDDEESSDKEEMSKKSKSTKSFLIQHSVRAKDFKNEGSWDDLDDNNGGEMNAQVAARDKQLREIRKAEAKAAAKKRRSAWDAALDAGRVKKVKKKKDDNSQDAFSRGPSAKDFQKVLDERRAKSGN